MTAAQATIRRLYEQVRVLEAEAARTPKRRTRLPYAGVLLAAVGIGAVSAGASQTDATAVVHRHLSHHAAPVVHLIDPPAERARALPAPRHHRVALRHRVARHAAAPARSHMVLTQHEVQPAAPPKASRQAPAQAPVHAAPTVHPAPVVRHAAPAPAPAQLTPAKPAPAHRALAKPAPARPAPAKPAPAKPAPPRPTAAKSAPEPVGIGPVVVSTSDEPLSDDAGATTTPTPTTPIP